MVIGIAGCVVPGIPGPPLSYIGLLLLEATDYADFSIGALVIWGILALITIIADYTVPMIGSKLSGGTKWGNYGSLVGTIIGLFFLPLGLILGPFLGALLGELISGNSGDNALKSALGALVGFVAGTLLKVIICLYFAIEFILAFF